MKAETVGTVYIHTYVLENKTGLVFIPKNRMYYVNEERVY